MNLLWLLMFPNGATAFVSTDRLSVGAPTPLRPTASLLHRRHRRRERTNLWSATSSDLIVESFDGTQGVEKKVLDQVSDFMMEAFWGVAPADSGDSYPKLLTEQKVDLNSRFGEILGRRKLQTKLMVGTHQERENGIVGTVGVEVALFDLKQRDILSYSQSEKTLLGAISSLGPKERRLYKDSSIVDLVTELPTLRGHYEAVAVLANLCVSPTSRGSGVGEKLCIQVEEVVRNWGLGKIMLKVEAENIAAKRLYAKLGYKEEVSLENSTTVRPDLNVGTFQEIPCTMLILSKSL